MSKNSIDTSGLKDLINQLTEMREKISKKRGTVDVEKEKFLIKGGPFLHQNTKEMTEKESAAFERENKKLFDYLRALDQGISELL